jgi:hypothetical protein
MMDDMAAPLFSVVGEVEEHLAEAGWDQPPQLFALVDTYELLQAEPQLARTMGLVAALPGSLTPIAQEELAEGPLDEALAGIEFGPEVLGVVLSHEVLVLPPTAEAAMGDADPVTYAATHPDRRDVRMVVGVVRDGTRECVLRIRGTEGETDERVTGPDLAPALADALLATLNEGTYDATGAGPAGH